jgi:predicted ATPase
VLATDDRQIYFKRSAALIGLIKKRMPIITFYDAVSQPNFSYYSLLDGFKKETGANAFDSSQAALIVDAKETPINRHSLQVKNSSSSLYNRLYRSTNIINSLSHFSEGKTKMDALLFATLTGQQVIRIDSVPTRLDY